MFGAMIRLPSWLKSLTPERYFLAASSFFGLLFLLLIPPFQVPDEPNHFYRAWQISEGKLLAEKKDQRVGGYLPEDLPLFVAQFEPVIWYGYNYKVSQHLYISAAESGHSGARKFFDFNNTALYSPLCYAPAAAGMFIARVCGANSLIIFYAGRIFNLLFFILSCYAALRLLPVLKWLMCFVMLLPMTLFINQSLSADSVTNSICFLFAGQALALCYGRRPASPVSLRLLFLSVLILSSVKIVYLPLLLILLLAPRTAFASGKQRLFFLSACASAAIITAYFWLSYTSVLHLSYEQYNPLYRDQAALSNIADLTRQSEHVKALGWNFSRVLINSFIFAAPDYIKGVVGVLGWHDLPLPDGLITFSYILIILYLLIGESRFKQMRVGHRTLFFLLFLFIFILVFVTQYLNWEMVGAEKMSIQGRYLLPLLPLLLCSFQGILNRKWTFMPYLLVFFNIISLTITVTVIARRYFPSEGFF